MKLDWLGVIVFLVGAVLYAIYGAEDLWRQYAMRRLAHEFRLKFGGKRLPEALSLYGTPFNQRRFTWNVMEGERDGIRVVIFDCQVGEGTGNLRRTVMSLRVGSDISTTANRNPGLTVLSSGGWAVISYPQEAKVGLTPVGELRAWLRSLEGRTG